LQEVKTTIRLAEELNETVRIAMAKRRVKSLQEAVVQALEQWLGQPSKPAVVAPVAPGSYPAAHREAHELLEEILRDGTPEQAGWIAGNLKTFVEAIRATPRAQRKRAG